MVIVYVRLTFRAYRLVIKDDSSIMISWIQSYAKGATTHPLLLDINLLFGGVTSLVIQHVHREKNPAVDWVVSFVAQHSSDVI